MVKFIGTPNMLVTLKPPIGTTKHIRFDANGEFNTENEHLINRLYHKFDSVPVKGAEPSEELTDDLELQDHHEESKSKVWRCNQCEFESDNKGVLLAHKKAEHPKED